MKARHLILLALLICAALLLQQYGLYRSQLEELSTLEMPHRDLSNAIEHAMYQEASLRAQLAAIEQQHKALRNRLPEELDEEPFLQLVIQLAERNRLKVLSSSTAIYSHPDYRQAQLRISLESSLTKAQPLLRSLRMQPRILDLEVPQQSGKKNLNFSITLYAVEPEAASPFTPPSCQKMPTGVRLPLLAERLSLRYDEYLKQCHFVANFSELLLVQQRLQYLQADNRRVQEVVNQLRPVKAR